jgi:hypothetical protein
VSFHGLRQFVRSISLRAATPLKVVSEMLGHRFFFVLAFEDQYRQVRTPTTGTDVVHRIIAGSCC